MSLPRPMVSILCLAALLGVSPRATVAEQKKTDVRAVVDVAWKITEVMLKRHVDPPSRQVPKGTPGLSRPYAKQETAKAVRYLAKKLDTTAKKTSE